MRTINKQVDKEVNELFRLAGLEFEGLAIELSTPVPDLLRYRISLLNSFGYKKSGGVLDLLEEKSIVLLAMLKREILDMQYNVKLSKLN